MKKFYTISILLSLLMLIQTQLFGGIRLQTPLEKSDYTTLSSHADMMAYLSKLDKQSKVMHMEISCKSAEG
ncbi:MAG: hypothetical protein P8184_14485, partial [Calditrichia bacterium]